MKLNRRTGGALTRRKAIQFLAVSIIALLAAYDVRAEQYIYHFSGTISQFEFDNAGLIANSGLQLGSPVQYTFLVDFQSPGYVTHYDGSTEVLQDIPGPGEVGNLYVHFFFADFLGGDILRDEAAELLRPDGGWLSSHHGSFSDSAGSRMGNLVGGGVYYYVGVYQQQAGGFSMPPLPWGYVYGDPSVEQWEIG